MGMTRRQFIVLGSTAGVTAAGVATPSRRRSANISSHAQRGPDRFVRAHAWRDIVIVKARSRARVRVTFEDFVGKTVQHCHILDHEDLGMMATLMIER